MKCLSFTKKLAGAKLLVVGKLLADDKNLVDIKTFSINQNVNKSDISSRSDN